jgi:hypothetical protein
VPTAQGTLVHLVKTAIDILAEVGYNQYTIPKGGILHQTTFEDNRNIGKECNYDLRKMWKGA